jgi:hypothetical protein
MLRTLSFLSKLLWIKWEDLTIVNMLAQKPNWFYEKNYVSLEKTLILL